MSLQIRCFKELVQYGAQEVLQREYGQYVVSPEIGYDFSILVDLENLPSDKGRQAVEIPQIGSRTSVDANGLAQRTETN